MNKLKNVLLKIVKPPTVVKAFLFIISGISLVFTVISGKSFIAVPFLSFIITAYTLAVIIAGLPTAVKKGRTALYSNPYSQVLLTDIKLRTRLRLTFGLFFNFFYAVFKLFTGIFFRSEWLISIGAYYFIICTSKFMLLRSAKEIHDDSIAQRRRELINCRYVGLLLFILSSVISGLAAKMVYDNETVGYPPYFFGLIAVYTAYRLISAVYSLIKYRRVDNPFYSTTKSLDLSSALMALLTLQTALLARYGTSPLLTRGLNSLTSAVVLLTVIIISVNIIIKNTKKIKKLVKE